MKDKDTYNIRQVIELTGVSEFTLRGWESRYGAVEPERNKTGRRLYSRLDILKIRLLIDLIQQGHRISHIAKLTLEQLQEILTQSTSQSVQSSQDEVSLKNPALNSIDQILALAISYKWDELQKMMRQNLKQFSPKSFVFDFVLPLISEIAHRVSRGELSVAQEHILSAHIKESLFYVRSQSKLRDRKGLRFVLATPEGDFHELGILIASTLNSIYGVREIYLGPHVPKKDLCETVLRFQATHILISATVTKAEGAADDFLKLINFVDRHLNSKVQILLAGRACYSTEIALRRSFTILRSFLEYEKLLQSQIS